MRFLLCLDLPVLSRSVTIVLLCDTFCSRRCVINIFRIWTESLLSMYRIKNSPGLFLSSLGQNDKKKSVKLRGFVDLKDCLLLVCRWGKSVNRNFIR